MPDVFISYKRTDRSRVDRIASLLREAGLDVWFDARLSAGSDEGFDAEINREVTSAHCVVACWTADAIKSIYVRAEALKGLETGRLTPVFLSKCDLPIPFNAIDAVDLSTWTGSTESVDWQRFLAVVKSLVAKSKVDEVQRRRQSQSDYERIQSPVYPGTPACCHGESWRSMTSTVITTMRTFSSWWHGSTASQGRKRGTWSWGTREPIGRPAGMSGGGGMKGARRSGRGMSRRCGSACNASIARWTRRSSS